MEDFLQVSFWWTRERMAGPSATQSSARNANWLVRRLLRVVLVMPIGWSVGYTE